MIKEAFTVAATIAYPKGARSMPRKTKRTFRRASPGVRNESLDDATGRVTVTVRLTTSKQKVVPGNRTRTFTVQDATVTDVADACEDALFSGQ